MIISKKGDGLSCFSSVYIAGFPDYKLTKIGITQNLARRIGHLRDEARLHGVPDRIRQQLRPLLLISHYDPVYLERYLLGCFSASIFRNSEWISAFDVDVADSVAAKLVTDHISCKLHWT